MKIFPGFVENPPPTVINHPAKTILPKPNLSTIMISRYLVFILTFSFLHAADFHLDASAGADENDGLSPATAWRSLAKASSAPLVPGDRLLLRRGQSFPGSLVITRSGTAEASITVTPYGPETDPPPVIDAKTAGSGIHINGASHLEINNLEITADGPAPTDSGNLKDRFGILITSTKSSPSTRIHLDKLHIHQIFAAKPSPHEGRSPTTSLGRGIEITAKPGNQEVSHVTIENSRIERTGWYGIRLNGNPDTQPAFIRILNNTFSHTGGSAIQSSRAIDSLVRGNDISHSGSSIDPRMHGRGSGMWTWQSSRILVEHNRFAHARGKGDSCGFHIDFGCTDVVVQYNFSHDNEGGFAEILGNCHNSIYRYNISVGDGSRERGKNGAHQNGKSVWLSGYVGKAPRIGPFHSYIYNNTVWLPESASSQFSIAPTSAGVFIANNIFYLPGPTKSSTDDQPGYTKKKPQKTKPIPNVVFCNNLYARANTIPKDLLIQDSNPIVGNPDFLKPGGTQPADYTPRNATLVKDTGIPPAPLRGGTPPGISLEATTDILGKSLTSQTHLGAIAP